VTIIIRAVSQLDDDSTELLTQARDAFGRSRSPLGSPAAGAAVLGESGRIYSGSAADVEAGGYTCAERAAVTAATIGGESFISVMAVVLDVRGISELGRRSIHPCGNCRQLLADLAVTGGHDVMVYITDPTLAGAILTTSSELMPDFLEPLLRHVVVAA
jgi:cytidine deaminase